jgi:hypothetical protein
MQIMRVHLPLKLLAPTRVHAGAATAIAVCARGRHTDGVHTSVGNNHLHVMCCRNDFCTMHQQLTTKIQTQVYSFAALQDEYGEAHTHRLHVVTRFCALCVAVRSRRVHTHPCVFVQLFCLIDFSMCIVRLVWCYALNESTPSYDVVSTFTGTSKSIT